MRLSMGLRTGASILALALLLTVFSGGVEAQMRSDVRALLDQGLDLLQQGKAEEAQGKFEQALLLDPTADEALDFVDRAGVEQILQQLRRNHSGDVAKQLNKLLQITALETRRRARDDAAINTALDTYFGSTDIQEQTRTIYRAVSEHGVYLMPGLVERLAVQETRTRTRAILGMTKISDDAVLPLTRVLHHSDPQVVLGAIAALKKIANDAAVPSLRWLAESTSDQIVKGAALDALDKLDPRSANSSAYELLLTQAGEFFRNPSYMYRTYHDPVVWALTDGALGYKDTHSWIVNELRAEQLITDALSLDERGSEARVWNVCNKLAQYAEYRAAVRLLEEKGADESKKTELEAEASDMIAVRYSFPYSQPAAVLYSALGRALDESRPEVAIEVIGAIRDSHTEGRRIRSVDGELLRAQEYAHRGVAFTAAECIAYMNPASGFRGSDRTLESICEGLVEAGARVALTIASSENDQLFSTDLLRRSHVVSFAAETGMAGVNRAKSFPPEDIIVISTNLSDMTPADVIRRLRADERTMEIPIFVLADGDFAKAEATYTDEAKKVQVIQRSIDPLRLKGILDGLFADDPSERGRSKEIAARAANALRYLATRESVFDLNLAQDALVTVLENRDDEVRIAACGALGSMGYSRATPALVRICNDPGTAEPLHVAALTALGDIESTGGSVDGTVTEVLDKGIMNGSAKIKQAAARSKGKIRPGM
ncbi:MAG: HEAT repeat domain-containing protein [Planctomycetota bacterium]